MSHNRRTIAGTVTGIIFSQREREILIQLQQQQRIEAQARRLAEDTTPGDPLPSIAFSVIDVSFYAVADAKSREYLQNLTTMFGLSAEAGDRLCATAA